MNTRSKALRNTVFSSIAIYTEYVLGMLTSIFIARHLGPADFGAYSAIIWLVAMGIAVSNSGTASAAIKFVAELRGRDQKDLIAPTIAMLRRIQRGFLAIVLVAGGLLFWLAGEHFAPGFNHLALFGFYVVAISLRAQYMFNIGIAKGFEDFRALAIIAGVATPLNLLMVIVAWWLDAEVEILLAVFLLSSAVFWLMSRARTNPLIPPAPVDVEMPGELRRRLQRHVRLVAVTVTVGFFIASDVEVFFLNLLDSASSAGYFKVAYQLASGAANLVPGVIGALLLPMMAGALSQGRDIAGRRFVASTNYLFVLAAPLAAFGGVFCAPIIELMYGGQYMPAIPVFAICLGACALTTASQGASSLLVSADRQLTILALSIVSGVVKVTLDLVLIHAWGLLGAAVAYLVVAVFGIVAMFTIAIRTIGLQPEWLRLLRIALAAILAAGALWPLLGHWRPLPTLLVGGVGMMVLYAFLTLLFGCWNAGDIQHLRNMHERHARGRPRLVGRLLAWSERRAVRDLP